MKKIVFAFFAAPALLSIHLCAENSLQSAQVTLVADASTTQNCNMLPADQQAFAAQLNASNKMMFCNQFSPEQRMNAMTMMGTVDSTGAKLSADQAVSKVASMNNVTPMQTAPQKSTGGCPVR